MGKGYNVQLFDVCLYSHDVAPQGFCRLYTQTRRCLVSAMDRTGLYSECNGCVSFIAGLKS